jgi:hypothetical protein
MTDLNEAIRAPLQRHWLVVQPSGAVSGCHCGFTAELDDCGYGDSVLAHILDAERTPLLREVERLRTELRLTEGDLTVAVAEATRARSVLRSADATSAELRRQLVGTNALLATVERQRQAVLDLCDARDADANRPESVAAHRGLTIEGLISTSELRTALEAKGNV